MAVCDAHYCFTLADIGDAGRYSDGGRGGCSAILLLDRPLQAMEAGKLSLSNMDDIIRIATPIPYFFVDDAAFLLKTYMIRPYPDRYLSEDKRIFNYRLSRSTGVYWALCRLNIARSRGYCMLINYS